jgi:hypothetical protein
MIFLELPFFIGIQSWIPIKDHGSLDWNPIKDPRKKT